MMVEVVRSTTPQNRGRGAWAVVAVAALAATGLAGCAAPGLDAVLSSVGQVPWLEAALAPEAPSWALPQDIHAALASVGAFEPVPLPEPAALHPLHAALLLHAARRDSLVDAARLHQQVDGLALDPASEASLARLVLAYLLAERMQQEAMSGLEEDEARLVALEPRAVQAWFDEDPERDMWALDQHIAGLLHRVDTQQTLRAADLLARAADAARQHVRPPVVHDVSLQGPWAQVHALIDQMGHAPPRAVDPALRLDRALPLLTDALGIPAPAAGPRLPPPVDRAIANIVAAHAAGARSGEPSWHAHWVLDAVRDALPALEAWDGSVMASGSTSTGSSACVVPPGQDIPPDLSSPPDVPPAPGVPSPGVPGPGQPIIAIPMPGIGPDCPDNPWLLLVRGHGDDTDTQPALIRIDLGGDDHYLSEVAGPANVTVGPPGDRRTRSIGSIHLDLAGDDHYDTPDMDHTQASSMGGFSLLLDAAGNDNYAARRASQGTACCFEGTPPAPPSMGGIALLLDLAGDDQYTGGQRSQGHAGTGALAVSPPANDRGLGVAGLLVDVAGQDHYRFHTQGEARAGGRTSILHETHFDRSLGVVWDMSGNDHYESIGTPVNPLTEDRFTNQGRGHDAKGGSVPTAVGLFLDTQGDDLYTVLDIRQIPPTPTEASSQMNNQQHVQQDPHSLGVPLGIGVFLDVDAATSILADGDGDGGPDILEFIQGTDPQDPDDRPSDIPDDGDPASAAIWLKARPARTATEPTGVFLPGLAILGPSDNALTERFDFVVDLGGDELYAAPGLGGLRPYEQRYVQPPGGLNEKLVPQPWFAALVLDLGAGHDTYVAPDHTNKVNIIGPAAPSIDVGSLLGGAVAGIAVVGDAGGTNSFSSAVHVRQQVTQESEVQRRALSTAFGVMQGGGLYGGVGVLVTWEADNSFDARTLAEAVALQGAIPHAHAMGVSQGGGWYGTGVMALFGPGTDAVHSSVRSDINNLLGSKATYGTTQGAARGGVGLLVDGGGHGSFVTDAPLAQGAAWTLGVAPNEPVQWAFGNQDPRTATSAIGILMAGPGDHHYQAPGVAQGTGVGIDAGAASAPGEAVVRHVQSPGTTHQGLSTTSMHGAPAIGMLVDLGGQDVYHLAGAGLGGQGAGILGGLGVLADLGGDDLYRAPGHRLVQGAAHLGEGVLLDVSGHDRYVAQGQAQGYATDDPSILLDARACLGQTHAAANAGMNVFCTSESLLLVGKQANYAHGTSQARVQLLAQFPTLGLLVDRQGADVYEGRDRVQGVAEAHLQYPVGAGACKIDHVNVFGLQRPALLPFVKPCEHPFYPSLPGGPQSWTAVDTALPPQGPMLLGIFIDASHTDRYDPVHEHDKEPLPPLSQVPHDGNDWVWRQVIADPRSLDQSRLPDDIFQGGPEELEAVDDPGRLIPSAPIPQELHGVLGMGVDTATLGAAGDLVLQEILGSLRPIQVGLTVLQQDGRPLTGTEAGQDVLILVAEVSLPPGIGPEHLDRLVFLADHGFLAQGSLVGVTQGVARYEHVWDTTLFDEDNRPLVRDGVHVLQASLFPVRGASIESTPVVLLVDNPPILDLRLQRGAAVPPAGPDVAISPTLGHRAHLDIRVSPDLEVPQGEAIGPGQDPGAYLTVIMTGPEEHTVLPTIYVPAGLHESILDGCKGTCSDRLADGIYEIRVIAEDSSGNVREERVRLLIDGTAPTSRVDMPAIAGTDHQSGIGRMAVRFAFDADPAGAGNTTGIQALDLFLVHAGDSVERVGGGTAGRSDVSGVTTGQVLTFVTVARDALGNTESPCQPGEQPAPGAASCAAAKLAAGKAGLLPVGLEAKAVAVDFQPPQVLFLASTHDHIAPGITPVRFETRVNEVGSGLGGVRLRLPGGTFDMVPSGNGHFVFDTWHSHNSGLPAHEQLFTYEVLAVDKAGNAGRFDATGTLDSMAPRLNAVGTEYRDATGTLRPAGKPGSTVITRAFVLDAALDSVRADFSGLDPQRADVPCFPDGRTLDPVWECQVNVPGHAVDGGYTATIRAVDKAGNAASLDVPLVIADQLLEITGLHVSHRGHDSLTLTWQTHQPGTAQVLYGRTSELGRATPTQLSYATSHEVTVMDLNPSSTYFLQVASQNQAGGENRSVVFSATTTSALEVTFPGLDEDQVLSGTAVVPVHVQLLSGERGARVAVAAESASGDGITQRLGVLEDVRGPRAFSFDTTRLADGAYRLVAEADRFGDFSDGASPRIIIDNTAPVVTPVSPLPGGQVPTTGAQVAVHVVDPLGQLPINPSKASVSVDGVPVASTVASWDPSEGQALLVLALAELPPGPADILISVVDAAGNEGVFEMPITAVSGGAGMSLQVDYGEPLTAARPEATVRLVLSGAAATKAMAFVSGITPASLPMERIGDAWQAQFTVPAVGSGTYPVAVTVEDAWGRLFKKVLANVTVDSLPPEVDVAAVAAGPAAVRVEVQANKPVRVSVATPTGDIVQSPLALEHAFAVTGLAPGGTRALVVTARDDAGHAVQRLLEVLLPADEIPPGPVQGLTVRLVDGAPLLTWSAAADDAGIASYAIRRTVGGDAEFLVSDLRFTDDQAPYGTQIVYHVWAVDVGGNSGPPARVTFHRTAPASLGGVEVVPERGPASQPFEVSVVYTHPSGEPPASIHVVVGSQRYAMHLTEARPDCETGCRLAAQVHLPATRQTIRDLSMHVEATWDAHVSRIDVPAPLVFAGPGASADVGKQASGLLAAAVAAVLSMAALLRRRWT